MKPRINIIDKFQRITFLKKEKQWKKMHINGTDVLPKVLTIR